MNKNELLMGLFSGKELRNAFISFLLWVVEKQAKSMNKNKMAIFAIISVLLISSVALTVDFAAAAPGAMAYAMKDNFSNRLTQASWIRLNGNIQQWGTVDVRGTLQVQAHNATHAASGANSMTSASAIWTTNLTRSIQAARTVQNYTYTFYSARLNNGSVSTQSSSTGSYFINGTWNVANVTSTVTFNTDENGTITHVHRDQDVVPMKAYGELKVTGNTFTLSITGLDPLTGSVYRQITRSWFNPFKMTDDSTSNVVTHADVKAIGACYGCMPGWGNFDQSMDFNNNYRVDIADISTVAANA
jgi:hypothetical protein